MNIITVSDFYLAYIIKDFVIRLYLMIIYDGVSGMMDPTLALMKSVFIDHKIRSTIINLFRLPTNICTMILLFASRYISTFQITLIIILFGIIGLIFSIYGMYLLEEFNFRKKINDTICVRIMPLSLLRRLENRNFLLDYEVHI